MKPKSRFVFTFVRKSMILTCLLLTLPVASLLADNLVYERVTSLSQLSQGMQLIICDRENARALSKNFLKITNSNSANTVAIQQNGDYFIGNDNIATFTYFATKNDMNLKFNEALVENKKRTIDYLINKSGKFVLDSKSYAYLNISFGDNGEATIKGNKYCLSK